MIKEVLYIDTLNFSTLVIKVEAVYSGGQPPKLLYKTVSFLGIRVYTYINADYKFKLEKDKIEKQIRFDQMDELEHA